jgi:hypothetical protein
VDAEVEADVEVAVEAVDFVVVAAVALAATRLLERTAKSASELKRACRPSLVLAERFNMKILLIHTWATFLWDGHIQMFSVSAILSSIWTDFPSFLYPSTQWVFGRKAKTLPDGVFYSSDGCLKFCQLLRRYANSKRGA